MHRNKQRIRKIPLKSTISEGFWSEWGDSNARSLEPKSSAIPTSLHPDIHFPAMIPRRGVKIKFFLSVVIYVVKAAFVPFSAIGEKSANACAARLCGISPYPVPDTATALPKQARYQLRYTRLFSLFIRLVVFSQSKRATNCANPGFLVIEFCARCGQTCGQAVFLTTSTCGGSACIVGVSRNCGHGIF